ncbi:MAG: serine protease [Myxococcales bacterium]|nr:serine protease [Myxococcales bacterium]
MPPKPEKAAPQAKAPEIPTGAVVRRDLEAVLREGPPWLLERVPIEEVVEGQKFVGWRIQELPVAWRDVDLRAGDVITAVNTLPLETPTDFWAAWTTLGVASEIKLAYQREGEPMELTIPILGAPNPEMAAELDKKPASPPAERPPAEKERRGTIVIKGDEKPLSDTLVDWSN